MLTKHKTRRRPVTPRIASLLVVFWSVTVAAGAAPTTTTSRPADAVEFGRILHTAKPGDVLLVPQSIGDLRTLRTAAIERKVADGAPQLLLSDAPEYFREGNGISLQEDVRPGRVRLYVYHVPGVAGPMKTITAVIENRGDRPMKLRLLRYAFPRPGTDYQRIGRAGLIDYFNSTSEPESRARTLPPGGCLPIDPAMDVAKVTGDQLVHGLYEFAIDQPGRITVLQRDPDQLNATAIGSLPKLPGKTNGGAGRGIFLTSDIDVTGSDGFVLDPARGPMHLRIADGRSDPWIAGRDSITGRDSLDRGNYGVMYRIRLKRIGTPENQDLGVAVLMTHTYKRSKWCSQLAAAVQINGQTVSLPSRGGAFEGFPNAALMAKLPPLRPGKTADLEILYSPPGASCLPTPILFVPYKP